MRKWTAVLLAAALFVPGPAFASAVRASIPLTPAAPLAFTGAALSPSAMLPTLAPALEASNEASLPIFAAPAAAALRASAPAVAAAPAAAAPSAPALSALAQAGSGAAAASVQDSGPRLLAMFDGSAPAPSDAAASEPESAPRAGLLARAVSRPAAAAALLLNAALAHAAPAAAAAPSHPATWGHLFASAALFAVTAVVASAVAAAAWIGIRKLRERRKEKAEETAGEQKGAKDLAWASKGSGMTTLGLSAPGEKRASFSRTPAAPQPTVTLDDIAGQDEAKAELANIMDFIKNKEHYLAVNPKVKGPKGALLIGPPGTGKTLLARAVAQQAGVPFRATKGSDFINRFVGTGASGIRDVFEELKAEAKGGPAILFIDEIDSIGLQRSGDDNNAEETRTLNALLAEMDGFEKDNIIVIAATNRADMLDTALLRGGRFGLKIPVGLPDVVGREAIFKVHTKQMAMTEDVDLAALAKQTPGLAGADLEEIVNDVTMKVGKRRDKKATMADFLKGVDRFTTGHERRMVMRDDEKLAVSYHEAGHALVSMLLPDADPVRKVTNIPHGLQALGFMQALPEQERMMYSREWLVDRMAADWAAASPRR
ncbi:MAG: AAA family ATPase [Elusimicrobiota bacterium]